ncbi:hypothetical protein [Mycolicibacterium sp. S3B2]|uniref:hypothetical protein n=1 Tax=Mycolicibacterium sp. S3B2 TaxID=3415120 RepID=UPI003C7C7423
MARPPKFDRDEALGCAMKVFWEKGFNGFKRDPGKTEIREWLQQRIGEDGRLQVPDDDADPKIYNEFADNIKSLFEYVDGANSLMETYWETYTGGYHRADPRIAGE